MLASKITPNLLQIPLRDLKKYINKNLNIYKNYRDTARGTPTPITNTPTSPTYQNYQNPAYILYRSLIYIINISSRKNNMGLKYINRMGLFFF